MSQELGPGLEVADTEYAGGVSLMPPATEEGVVCEALPTRHERHLVLQDGCVVANADVVWMLGDREFFLMSAPNVLRVLGQCCVTYKGMVQSLSG